MIQFFNHPDVKQYVIFSILTGLHSFVLGSINNTCEFSQNISSLMLMYVGWRSIRQNNDMCPDALEVE